MLAVRPILRKSTQSSRFSRREENKPSSNLSTVEPIVKMSASELSCLAPHTPSIACSSTDLRSESQVDIHCASITGCLPTIKSCHRLNHQTPVKTRFMLVSEIGFPSDSSLVDDNVTLPGLSLPNVNNSSESQSSVQSTSSEQSMVTSTTDGIPTNTNIFMTKASVHQKYSHITNVDIDFPAIADTYFENSDVKRLPEVERKDRNKMIPVQSNLIKEVDEIFGAPPEPAQGEVTVTMSQQLRPMLAPKES